MTRTSGTPETQEQRAVLGAIARAWDLESSVTAAQPELCWPQVRTRTWGSPLPLLAATLDREETQRMRPWLRMRTALEGSSALIRHGPYTRGSELRGICAFTHDQRRLLADGHNCLLVYDASGRLESRLALTASPRAVAIAKSSRRVACAVLGSGYTAPSLTMWDITEGELLARAADVPEKIEDCVISPDDAWVVSASRDGKVIVWDARDLTRHAILEQPRAAAACRFAPDGSFLVTAGRGGPVKVWSTDTWRERLTLDHASGVDSVAIGPDGSRIVSAGGDGTLHVWSETGVLEATLDLEAHPYRNICFVSPDGKLVVASAKNVIRAWNIEDGTLHLTLDHHAEVIDLAIGPDATWLVSAGLDGTLKIWDLATGELMSNLPAHPFGVRACAVSPDGTTIASTGGFDNALKAWELDAARGSLRLPAGHRGRITDLAFTPDAATIVSAGDDGSVKLLDAEHVQERATLTGHDGPVSACAVGRDGTVIASGGEDGTIRLWNVATMDERATLPVAGSEVLLCAFDREGGRLASINARRVIVDGEESTERSVAIWDLTDDGTAPTVMPCPNGRPLAMGESGLLLARRDDESLTLALWDPWRDVVVWEERFGGWRDTIPFGALAPDGAWGATLSGGLLVWDGDRGIETIGWHRGGIACSFSSDGSLIASVGGRSLRVWDWTPKLVDQHARTLLAELVLPHPLTCVGFLPDGLGVVCGDESGVVHVVDVACVDPPVPVARRRREEAPRGSRPVRVWCPACSHAFAMTAGWLWQLAPCPACGENMRVAPSYRRF